MLKINMRSFLIALTIALAFSLPSFAADTDGDGLDDLVETNTGIYIDQFDTGTDPINPDSDFDGVSDGHEVASGAHPLDPTITSSSWKTGSDMRITNALGFSRTPSLVWSGTEYGVSWQDGRAGNLEIYFARIDASGNKIGSDVRITDDDENSSYEPSLVWSGTEYGVSWLDWRDGGAEIYFARMDASGNKIGAEVRITNDINSSIRPSLAWTGTEYGVSWEDDRDVNTEIYFARIDASGNKIGSDVRITNANENSIWPSLVWTGTEYGVSWYDFRDDLDGICDQASGTMDCNKEIYFARIDASGTKIGADVRITNDTSFSQYPSLAWTGTEYGVSWNDGRDGLSEIYFTRIDASGNKIGPDMRITNDGISYSPSLVWIGTEYGVSWVEDRDGNYEIYFARIDALGNKIGADVRITNNLGWSDDPSLAWTGSEYGVSWHDNRASNPEIYFARIEVDEDGDGLFATQESVLGTNPDYWDSDVDNISDLHEYWGATDPLVWEPACGPTLFCYGDQDGDGIATLADYNAARDASLLIPVDYSQVYPSNGETIDVDASSVIDLIDINILRDWSLLLSNALADPGTPATVTILSPPDFTVVPMGATVEVVIEVRGSGSALRPGVGVVFELLTSTSEATLLGGRGNAALKTDPDTGLNYTAGSRWSVTGDIASGATAKIILRQESWHVIQLRARVPQIPLKQMPASISTTLTLN